jgi:hypothetical protein
MYMKQLIKNLMHTYENNQISNWISLIHLEKNIIKHRTQMW